MIRKCKPFYPAQLASIKMAYEKKYKHWKAEVGEAIVRQNDASTEDVNPNSMPAQEFANKQIARWRGSSILAAYRQEFMLLYLMKKDDYDV